MGGTRYDEAIYEDRVKTARDTGRDYFAHTESIERGETKAEVHEKLDPKKPNKVGLVIRESMDSPTCPNSRAVGVIFDHTGSMSTLPRVFKDKLPKLMATLVKKGFIPDPQILMGAVGDAYSDKAPVQIGQFEGGNETDEALANIYLEGQGGPFGRESYELPMWFLAEKAKLDCLEKRGQKGILFFVGDEVPYDPISKALVQRIFGEPLQEDIPLEQVVNKLKEKFDVFWIMPKGSSGWASSDIEGFHRKLWVQNFLRMEEPTDICEFITSTIGILEGYDIHDVKTAMKDVGADSEAVDRATRALVPFAKSRAVTRAATASGPLVEAGKDEVARL